MINFDTTQFNSKEGLMADTECILISPNNITCVWDDTTLKFRSLAVNKKNNEIISRGFDKFFNWNEKPDLDKFPDGPFTAIAKKDGSLLIWGYYNNHIISRTRNTFNAEFLQNGHEIQLLKNKYKYFVNDLSNFADYSILTEWQTKSNVIVINEVEEPTLTLIGVIHNDTGELKTQTDLDSLAKHWKLDRPKVYEFSSISECLNDVQMWEGIEGVVVYSEDGQKLRKIKSDWYCDLHKIRTGITTLSNVIDIFIDSPKYAKYSEFYEYITKTIDFEVAEKIKDHILTITVAYTKVLIQLEHVKQVVNNVRSGFSRKEQALHFQDHWSGGDWRLPIAFNLLDGKEITDGAIKNAILSNCVCAESLSQTGT